MPELKKDTIIARDELEVLAGERWNNAQALAKAGHYGAAIYMGGYAVECLLKARICKVLEVDRLPSIFATHQLDALLFFGGLERALDRATAVKKNWVSVLGVWKMDKSFIRYDNPANYTSAGWESFKLSLESTDGILPWLRNQL